MRTLQKFKLGTFEVTQPELIISDPCYAPGTWCMGIVPNAQPGIWEAEIGFFHEGKHDAAVAYLAAFHQHCPPKNQLIAREELFKVGVDSGQAGVFDKPFYRAGLMQARYPAKMHWKRGTTAVATRPYIQTTMPVLFHMALYPIPGMGMAVISVTPTICLKHRGRISHGAS